MSESIIKYTHDRHHNIVPIDVGKMNTGDLILYSSYRPIRDTIEVAQKEIHYSKPIRVDTGTWPNDHYYI